MLTTAFEYLTGLYQLDSQKYISLIQATLDYMYDVTSNGNYCFPIAVNCLFPEAALRECYCQHT